MCLRGWCHGQASFISATQHIQQYEAIKGLYGIGRLDCWTGTLDWNTGMTFDPHPLKKKNTIIKLQNNISHSQPCWFSNSSLARHSIMIKLGSPIGLVATKHVTSYNAMQGGSTIVQFTPNCCYIYYTSYKFTLFTASCSFLMH